ncbi:aminotransferase class IV family protein [Mesorhizobium sp. A623]
MSAQGPLRNGEPAGFDLIETMRWEPGDGFVRFERHLARLRASASELGFDYGADEIGSTLESTVSRSALPLRVRLVLARNGTASATTQAYEPLPADAVWSVKLAQTRLASTDGLLRHKTTRREVYVRARAEYPAAQADEVLLTNERGEVCEGTITTLFADFCGGILLTPRLGCGLLAGVLRAEMLDRAKAKEAVLTMADLRTASALYVGNSLRGLIPARLA